MSRVDQYRRWFEYEQASHAQVIDSLDSVPAAARRSSEYSKAVSLLAHLAAARQLWLHRLGGSAHAPATFFPDRTLQEARSDLAQVETEWKHYLERLSEADLDQDFTYQSTEGDRYQNRIEDILTQLYGHSLYHRGQIALLVRSLGGTPAETDFIFWTRQPLA